MRAQGSWLLTHKMGTTGVASSRRGAPALIPSQLQGRLVPGQRCSKGAVIREGDEGLVVSSVGVSWSKGSGWWSHGGQVA